MWLKRNPGDHLTKCIEKLADFPTARNERSLLRALAAVDELIVRSSDSATKCAASGPPFTLQASTYEARTYLVAFPTLAAATGHDPEAAHLGVSRASAFEMVVSSAELDGIMFRAGNPSDAWSIVRKSTLSTMIGSR